MTKTDLLQLITDNLATGSNITALKHRDVENAIVDYFSSAIGNPIVAYGKIGPIDIARAGDTSYGVTGNLSSAIKGTPVNQSYPIRVTIPSGLLSSTEYKVRMDVQSVGTSIDGDNNMDILLFKIINTNTFDIVIEETEPTTNNSIYIHVEVVALWS